MLSRSTVAILFVVVLSAFFPTITNGQTSTSTVSNAAISASVLGEGWTALDQQSPYLLSQNDSLKQPYVGPDGSVVVIAAFDLSDGPGDLSREWFLVSGVWKAQATRLISGLESDFNPTTPPASDGITEASVAAGTDIWTSIPVAAGVFATSSTHAYIISVQGTVNGVSGAGAVMWVLQQVLSRDSAT